MAENFWIWIPWKLVLHFTLSPFLMVVADINNTTSRGNARVKYLFEGNWHWPSPPRCVMYLHKIHHIFLFPPGQYLLPINQPLMYLPSTLCILITTTTYHLTIQYYGHCCYTLGPPPPPPLNLPPLNLTSNKKYTKVIFKW